jgi:hypothetical protein
MVTIWPIYFNNQYLFILCLWTIISLNSVNQLIFVMVKCGVFFAVRTEILNIIQTSFGFKELIKQFVRRITN